MPKHERVKGLEIGDYLKIKKDSAWDDKICGILVGFKSDDDAVLLVKREDGQRGGGPNGEWLVLNNANMITIVARNAQKLEHVFNGSVSLPWGTRINILYSGRVIRAIYSCPKSANGRALSHRFTSVEDGSLLSVRPSLYYTIKFEDNCSYCGSRFVFTTIFGGSTKVCKDCTKKLHQCQNCHSLITEDNPYGGYSYCSKCVDKYFVQCYRCANMKHVSTTKKFGNRHFCKLCCDRYGEPSKCPECGEYDAGSVFWYDKYDADIKYCPKCSDKFVYVKIYNEMDEPEIPDDILFLPMKQREKKRNIPLTPTTVKIVSDVGDVPNPVSIGSFNESSKSIIISDSLRVRHKKIKDLLPIQRLTTTPRRSIRPSYMDSPMTPIGEVTVRATSGGNRIDFSSALFNDHYDYCLSLVKALTS